MKRLQNQYGVWTEEQAEALREYWVAGICPYQIGRAVGKTAAACRGKAIAMGLHQPAKRGPKPRDASGGSTVAAGGDCGGGGGGYREPPLIALSGPVWSIPKGCVHVGARI
jgi:hypothetical protein